MGKLIKGSTMIALLLSLLAGCLGNNPKTETGEYRIDNIRIYQNTPAWELAKAVNSQDIKKIARIAEETPEVLDYQDPLYGTTLLFWAVGMEKYNSTEALLKAGADPDVISTYEGGTALYRASGYSFIDYQAKKDAKFVKLLLEYGADPNIGFVGSEHDNSTELGTTPLMESIGCGIEKTKALVEAGADINYRTEEGATAAILAIWFGRGGGEGAYAYYLIVEKKADVTKPWIRTPINSPSEEVAPVTFLRDWIPKLDSEGYKLKMEIVDEFAQQGEDYWATEIPKNRLEQIQKLYPDTWEEYISRY